MEKWKVVFENGECFEGWGINIAWWANTIGSWPGKDLEKIADYLFCGDGLGVNIVRYNIGAGDAPEHDHMNTPYFMHAQMEGYAPRKGEYCFESDLAERRILLEAKKRGVCMMEAFANSAPWWMTVSGCSAGNVDALPNFNSDYTEEYAVYLAEVIKDFHDKCGIDFRTIAPFNEPDNAWGHLNAQEGMVVRPKLQGEIICSLHKKLQEYGLKTQISANDVTNMDHILEQYPEMGKKAHACIGQINVHAYGGNRGRQIYDFVRREGKRLWMSEFGCGESEDHNNMGSALQLSETIMKDLRELRPAAWIYWQPVENEEVRKDSWGLIHAKYLDDSHDFFLTKQYYIYKIFTCGIKPGSRIMSGTPEDVLAAFDESGKRLSVIMHNNGGNVRQMEVDFGCFLPEPNISVFLTSQNENYKKREDTMEEGSSFVCSCPPMSVICYCFTMQW